MVENIIVSIIVFSAIGWLIARLYKTIHSATNSDSSPTDSCGSCGGCPKSSVNRQTVVQIGDKVAKSG